MRGSVRNNITSGSTASLRTNATHYYVGSTYRYTMKSDAFRCCESYYGFPAQVPLTRKKKKNTGGFGFWVNLRKIKGKCKFKHAIPLELTGSSLSSPNCCQGACLHVRVGPGRRWGSRPWRMAASLADLYFDLHSN